MPEPITPYQKGSAVWDERIGSAACKPRMALDGFGCLMLSAGLAIACLAIGARVPINALGGEVIVSGRAQRVAPANTTINPPTRDCLHWARYRRCQRPAGRRMFCPELLGRMILRDAARARLTDMHVTTIRLPSGKAQISVRSRGYPRSPDSFPDRWIQRIRQRLVELDRGWTGFSRSSSRRRAMRTLRIDPLGVTRAINWSKELGSDPNDAALFRNILSNNVGSTELVQVLASKRKFLSPFFYVRPLSEGARPTFARDTL